MVYPSLYKHSHCIPVGIEHCLNCALQMYIMDYKTLNMEVILLTGSFDDKNLLLK